ncbi:MAG: SHOCT domain-containing protein [Acidimicrobiia bacterium]
MMNGGWGWMVGGVVVMVAFWALLFWVVVSLVRRPTRPDGEARTATAVLVERFARGEIDGEEYESRRAALDSR